MSKLGSALAVVVLGLCVCSARPGHAQVIGGVDVGGAALSVLGTLLGQPPPLADVVVYNDGGVGRPIVWENGEWGYRDRYGRWNHAPEGYRRAMEARYPHGAGFGAVHPGPLAAAHPGAVAAHPVAAAPAKKAP